MLTSSAKAKGRRCAQELQRLILKHFPHLGEDDVRVTPSGVQGSDLQLSTLAKRALPFVMECKNVEKLNIWSAIKQAKANAVRDKCRYFVAFKRNRGVMHVAIEAEVFIALLGELLRVSGLVKDFQSEGYTK